jgi:hypothetical protein
MKDMLDSFFLENLHHRTRTGHFRHLSSLLRDSLKS